MSGSYNSDYHAFDVYVRSNQPDAKVNVTDAVGASEGCALMSGSQLLAGHSISGSATARAPSRVGCLPPTPSKAPIA